MNQLIDLLGLMPGSITVITAMKKKYSLLKRQSYVRPDHCFSQTNFSKMATNSLQFMHFGRFSSHSLVFNQFGQHVLLQVGICRSLANFSKTLFNNQFCSSVLTSQSHLLSVLDRGRQGRG